MSTSIFLFFFLQYLEGKKEEFEKLVIEKGESKIARPQDWGGHRLRPDYFEFWQGHSNRIDDQSADGTEWLTKHLSP
uniref:PNP_phzG_C domain-containing protein n=1 Tax=Onchocerca volvulus TaxID=6282 RepID=A0A8R1TMU8_ONCVO